MTTLGLGSEIPHAQVALGFRNGWVSHIKVALSSAGGAAVILAAFELLQRQPQAGFTLLAQWGPWPFLALLLLMFLGRFMSRMNDTIQTTFSSVVDGVQRQAQAGERQADAFTKLADQGGRQAEEVRRLAIYAGRELGSICERLDKQDAVMDKVAVSVQGIHARLSGIASERHDEGRVGDERRA